MDKQHNINNTFDSEISKKKSLITDYFKPVIIKESNSKVNYSLECGIDFKPVIIKESNTKINYCLECGVDMGDYMGQLCRKSFCDGKF